MFLVSSIMLVATVVFTEGIYTIPFIICYSFLMSCVVFSDTKWVSRRVRKTFEGLENASHNK